MAYVLFNRLPFQMFGSPQGVPPPMPPHAGQPLPEGFHVAPGEEFGGLLVRALGKHVGAKDARLRIESQRSREGRVC